MGLGLGLRTKLETARFEAGNFFANTFRRPNLFNQRTQERIGAAFREPSDMCATDRIMLYALMRGLRPERCLEIGVRWGNSARIFAAAMEDNGCGRMIGIDPATENFRAKPSDLYGRYLLHRGYSPDDVPAAMDAGKLSTLDFVFIDGMHIYQAVRSDLAAVAPYLEDGAHILLHDAFHQGINQAVSDLLEANKDFNDCGILTRSPTRIGPVGYQGLRLIRKGGNDSRHLISKTLGSEISFGPDVWNWDEHYHAIQKIKEHA